MTRQSICVLVPGHSDTDFVWNRTLPGIALSITPEEASEFSFGVYVKSGTNGSSGDMVQHNTSLVPLQVVSLPVDASSSPGYEHLLQAAAEGACTFVFMLDQSQTEFTAPGWVSALVRAMHSLSPQFLGAAGLVGCKGCLFVHGATHRAVFSRLREGPHSCWSQWMRSVYGPCRVEVVNSAAIRGGGDYGECFNNKQNNSSLEISRGRLYVRKALSLSLERRYRVTRK